MLATALIVFREVLEAALVIGIVMAATEGVAGRNRWICTGIGMGTSGAVLVAFFADVIAGAVAGLGQEIFNALILFLAVGMLGWHNVWMGRHGRELATEAASIGQSVKSGQRPLYALALAVGLAVLREGSETVLFLYGISAGDDGSLSDLLGGGGIGFVLGATAGAGLYFGLLRIPPARLFSVTSWMILLLAAGLAAQAAVFLVQADLLPDLGSTIWDTSAILTDESIPGRILHTLIGYVARPSGIQVIFYLATLLTIGTMMRLAKGAAPVKN